MSVINTVFIFAAGLGTRLKPLTNDIPKPLVKINGKYLLYYALELLLKFPLERIVINSHYLPDQIKKAVDEFKILYPQVPEIVLVYEPELLDTGGGLKNAVCYYKSDVIFTLNSDVIILSKTNILQDMVDMWNDDMHGLCLLQKKSNAIGYHGKGDFDLCENYAITNNSVNLPYVYAGLSLINTKFVIEDKKKIFSLGEYYIKENKFHGIINDGDWYHVGYIEDLEYIENAISINSYC